MRGAFHWIDRWRLSEAFKTMTLAEQGAFRNLLDELWLTNGVLPDDDRLLARLCGDPTQWKKVRTAVMAKFYKVESGWRNRTHDEVSAESKRRADKQARYREEKKKQRNASGNEPGNAGSNEPANVPSSLFTVHCSPGNELPGGDGEIESARAELRKAIQTFREFVGTGESDQVILELPKFHSTGGGVVRIDTCDNAALMRATTAKVLKSSKPSQPKPKKAKAARDSSDWIAAEDQDNAESEAWISANWPPDCDPQTESDLRGLLATLKPPIEFATVIEAALFRRHPAADADWAARVERMRNPQEPKEPAPKRPDRVITTAPGSCPTCGSPIRHSTEGGETILRCTEEAGPCAWAAVWRSVAA